MYDSITFWNIKTTCSRGKIFQLHDCYCISLVARVFISKKIYSSTTKKLQMCLNLQLGIKMIIMPLLLHMYKMLHRYKYKMVRNTQSTNGVSDTLKILQILVWKGLKCTIKLDLCTMNYEEHPHMVFFCRKCNARNMTWAVPHKRRTVIQWALLHYKLITIDIHGYLDLNENSNNVIAFRK